MSGDNRTRVGDLDAIVGDLADHVGWGGPGRGAGKGGKGGKKGGHRHAGPRPCGAPPLPPTGVVLTFQATEARTHLRFTGRVTWNETTADEGGLSVRPVAYDVQLRATNALGVPVETEDSRARIRLRRKEQPQTVNLKKATNPSGTTFRFETRRGHGLLAGDNVRITGCKKPATYNGTYTVALVVDATTFTVNGGSSGVADCEDPGQVIDDDDRLHVITEELPRPKTWYWQARVRAEDKEGCKGDFTDWTAPGLPWTGANPQPPAPTFGANPITFDRVGRGKRRRTRLKFTFNEVLNWDVPGGDREDDLRHYLVVIDRSDDGITWDGTPWYRKKLVPSRQDTDADTTRTVHFRVARGQWYRAKVKSFDRFNRSGPFSAFTDAALPFDDVQPPRPENVRIFDNSVDRIVVDWTAPTADYPTRGTVSGTSGSATVTGTGTKFTVEVEAGERVRIGGVAYRVKKVTSDTALTLTTNLSTSPSGVVLYIIDEHFDVNRYRAQIAKSSDVDQSATPDDWNDVYDTMIVLEGTKASFKIPEADQDLSFNGRVQSVDSNRNRSKFIPATVNGNSDPDANGSAVSLGVTVDQVRRRTIVTWTVPGTVQEKHYEALWVADRKYVPIKVRARVGRHRAADHPAGDGTPGGKPLIANLRWHNSDETVELPLMDQTDRLKIPSDNHKDVVWAEQFNVQSIALDEQFSLKVPQAGGSRAAKNLVVQLVLQEDQEENVLNVGGFSAHGRGYGRAAATVV
jgi:hypothetical protein